MERVWAIVVTFNPEPEALGALLAALVPQVERVVLVDNASSTGGRAVIGANGDKRLQVVDLPENLGVAVAHNTGLRLAAEAGADHAVLFDQDSVPAPDMVVQLLRGLARLRAAGRQVAAVGPRYAGDASPPFRRLRGVRIAHCRCAHADDLVPVDHLIASGCLIPLEVLPRTGWMREDLFIDYVDIEWGLRVHARGYATYGVCAALLAHRLGDSARLILGKVMSVHAPLRHYYMFRNAVWLYRQGWVPWRWKLADGLNLFLKMVFYISCVTPRRNHFRMILRGLADGLSGRLGRWV